MKLVDVYSEISVVVMNVQILVTDPLPSVTGVKVLSKNVAIDTEQLDPVFIEIRS